MGGSADGMELVGGGCVRAVLGGVGVDCHEVIFGVCHCAGAGSLACWGALAIGEQCNRRQMRFRVDYGIFHYMILGGWPGQLGGPRFGVTNYEFLRRTRNS